MDLGQVLQRSARQRAIEVVQRFGRGQALGALDQAALQFAPQHRLEAADVVAVERVGVAGLLARLLTQLQRSPDPLHVDADHAGALALAAESRDRQARQVAHLAVGAGPDRLLNPLPQVLEVDALAAVALEALLA